MNRPIHPVLCPKAVYSKRRSSFFVVVCSLLLVGLWLPAACKRPEVPATAPSPVHEVEQPPAPREDSALFQERRLERDAMVRSLIASRSIDDEHVLEALRRVPRHLFVPEEYRDQAYADHALPIGERQTISQPYIVALMTEQLALRKNHKVLEIGTGSGYQAAILAELVAKVYSIEIIETLSLRAAGVLEKLGYENITLRHGDGYRGWPEEAPFDAIIVTAAPDHIPKPLLDQLKVGGRLVIPVGSFYQELIRLERTAEGFEEQRITPVRFVPMTGEAEER